MYISNNRNISNPELKKPNSTIIYLNRTISKKNNKFKNIKNTFIRQPLNPSNTAICMAGALIPDVCKIVIPLEYLGVYAGNFILPFHMPVGSFIIASIFSLFFKEQKIVLLFLLSGVLTHYTLDLLLTNLSGGIYLLYPFSWGSWQFDVILADDFNITILAVLLAVFVYFIFKYVKTDNS